MGNSIAEAERKQRGKEMFYLIGMWTIALFGDYFIPSQEINYLIKLGTVAAFVYYSVKWVAQADGETKLQTAKKILKEDMVRSLIVLSIGLVLGKYFYAAYSVSIGVAMYYGLKMMFKPGKAEA